MKVALEHNERSGEVYEQHVLCGDSFEVPRDVKQVRSLGSNIRANKGGCNNVKITNVADNIQSVINDVQDNDFIQSVILSKGRSPVIIAYLPDQVKDMYRFCNKDTPAAPRSVIGVDRTFNLGTCFVTTLVYKNKSVIGKESNDNPVMLRPIMFHFDGKMETYLAFFFRIYQLC